jgi:hypothetical protein
LKASTKRPLAFAISTTVVIMPAARKDHAMPDEENKETKPVRFVFPRGITTEEAAD